MVGGAAFLPPKKKRPIAHHKRKSFGGRNAAAPTTPSAWRSVLIIERTVLQKRYPTSMAGLDADGEQATNACGSYSATEERCAVVLIIFRDCILPFKRTLHLHHVLHGDSLGLGCLVKSFLYEPLILEFASHLIESGSIVFEESVFKHAVVLVSHSRLSIEGREPTHRIVVVGTKSSAVALLGKGVERKKKRNDKKIYTHCQSKFGRTKSAISFRFGIIGKRTAKLQHFSDLAKSKDRRYD